MCLCLSMQGTSLGTSVMGPLRGPDGRLSSLCAFFLEDRESWSSGRGGDPVMQIAAYYTRMLLRNWDSPAMQQSFFPAVGVEVVTECMR